MRLTLCAKKEKSWYSSWMIMRWANGRLHLAEKTIKNYVSGLLSELGRERPLQAAAFVARMQVEQQRR